MWHRATNLYRNSDAFELDDALKQVKNLSHSLFNIEGLFVADKISLSISNIILIVQHDVEQHF
jgi:hypothetical protein